MTPDFTLDFDLYMIRSKDGKFLRATGIGGGDRWVENPSDGKIWTKLSTVRSQVTWWSKNYPKFGVPDIVRIKNAQCEVVDDSARVAKAKAAADRAALRNQARRLEAQRQALLRMQANITNQLSNLK